MALGGCLAAVLATCVGKDLSRQFCKTVMASLLVPPVAVRGMTELDRSKFTTVAEVPVLCLGQENLPKVMQVLKKYVLKVQKFKPLQNAATNDNGDDQKCAKVAYLDPAKVQSFEDIELADRTVLQDNGVTEIIRKKIALEYDNWRYDQVFKAIFPEGAEVPNSYSKVGHILHLNLRDMQLPYKHLIGEVLLDKISHARTVVNKLNTIDTTYRHFAMEILAGDQDTLATVSENGCRYKFDFATVYWNPRLSTEHQTLVSYLKTHDVLYDVFAGVGPFAIPAAKKGNRVMANDLNPESYRWLQENAKLNKTSNNVTAFNKDGREFLRVDVKNDILNRRNLGAAGVEHIAMNLPGIAVEFLSVFTDWFSEEDGDEAVKLCQKPPMVHLYCFVKLGKDEDPHSHAKLLVEENLGRTLAPDSLVTIHHEKMGKNKAPHKTKNVFKVAGARSLKHKAKAQKVSTDLKKLNIKAGKKSAKGKTTEVDKQLVELRKEVLQGKQAKIVNDSKSNKKQKPKQKVNAKTRMATRAQTEAAANLVEGMQI